MAAAFLQSRSLIQSTSGTTLGLAYSGANTLGSLLSGVFLTNGGTAITVSDSVNGSWTPIGVPQVGTGGLAGWLLQLFYFANNLAGGVSTTVTMTANATVTRRQMAIHEYTGVQYLEGSGAYSVVNGVTHADAPPQTPVLGTDVIFGGCLASTSVTNVTNGFNSRESGNFGANSSSDKLNSTAGIATQAGYDISPSGDTVLASCVFTPSLAVTVRQLALTGVGI